MPPKRNSRTVSSKKDGDIPVQITFCHETGESYRPFTDPNRIEANDKKKGSNCDSRAHVPGVPGHLLGIMDSDISPVTDKDKSRRKVQIRRTSVSRSDFASPISPEGQQVVFTTDTPAQVADKISDYPPLDALYPPMNGIPSSTPALHVEIPQANTSQNEYDSFFDNLQGSFNHSPFHDHCTSTYQEPPQLALPCESVGSLEADQDEQLRGTLHFSALGGGWSDGTIPSPEFHYPFDTTSSSPSSQSDTDSPMSAYLSSSMDTLHQGHFPCTCSGDHHASCYGQFTFGDRVYTQPDYLTGSGFCGNHSPTAPSSVSTDVAMGSVIAETQEMTGKLFLNSLDLLCRGGDVNLDGYSDHNTIFSPSYDPVPGQELIPGFSPNNEW